MAGCRAGQSGRVSKPADAAQLRHHADLEIGDTAGLETCATPAIGGFEAREETQNRMKPFVCEGFIGF